MSNLSTTLVVAELAEASLVWRTPKIAVVRLAGRWCLENKRPNVTALIGEIKSSSSVTQIEFDAQGVSTWDTVLLEYLVSLINHVSTLPINVNKEGLPRGVQQLLSLVFAVPEKSDTETGAKTIGIVARIGVKTLDVKSGAYDMLRFIGEVSIALGRMLCGKARYRRSELFYIIQQCGPQALPVVTLISFLVGVILAYVGAVQLQLFGAEIYVANLVGLAMARVMGALMTGIIMAGRSGAAFAAQLGTMQVNEEIDAYKTLGISPVEFLVLPRMLALILMVPLLTLYSDFVGILAGFLIGVSLLDIGVMEYYHQTKSALDFRQFAVGLIQASVFGVLIAIAGCLRGMQCGRSAAAVGAATTSAVVTSIVFIVVAAGLLTILFNQLGI